MKIFHEENRIEKKKGQREDIHRTRSAKSKQAKIELPCVNIKEESEEENIEEPPLKKFADGSKYVSMLVPDFWPRILSEHLIKIQV